MQHDALWCKQCTSYFPKADENCLGDLNPSCCVIYLDDIIVFGKTSEEHLQRLAAAFEKIRQAKLKLKQYKYNFFGLKSSI